MFAQIKKHYGDTLKVRGNSWLYNIDSYRRLFPAQYTRDVKLVEDEFQYISLWGQFLQRDGQIREHLVDAFLSCLQKAETFKDLTSSFPYQVLSPQGPIALFYKFYEIEALE